MSDVTIDLRGLPEVKAMLAQVQGQPLQNRVRRALRAGAKPIREEMRRKGKAGWPNRPASFNKTRTRGHRNPVGVSVSPKSALSTIFEHGAAIHVIEPKHGRDLVNRETGFYSIGGVYHPGVAARPFIGPVFDASENKAETEIGRVLFEGLEK